MKNDKQIIRNSILLGLALGLVAVVGLGFTGQAKFGVLWSNTIQPLIQGTGQVGTETNPYNSMCADSFMTSMDASSPWGKVSIYNRTSDGRPGFYCSDSVDGQARKTYSITWWGALNQWYAGGGIATNGKINNNYGELTGAGGILTKGGSVGIGKNNLIHLQVNLDNPYIAFSDSATEAARTRDSLVYNGASFSVTKPLVMTVYASGTRPTTAELGQVICIDGTTTSDSLLVYLGGAWVVLKP